MTFEEFQTAEPKCFAVFLDSADGDLEMVRRTFEIGQRRHLKFMAEWDALIDLCGPQGFINRAMARNEHVGPWHRAVAHALGRAAPNRGKLR